MNRAFKMLHQKVEWELLFLISTLLLGATIVITVSIMAWMSNGVSLNERALDMDFWGMGIFSLSFCGLWNKLDENKQRTNS